MINDRQDVSPTSPAESGNRNSTELAKLQLKWTNWEAFALFKSAGRFGRRRNVDLAITLLERSLAADPHFLPAINNLTAIRMERDESKLQRSPSELRKHYSSCRLIFSSLWDQFSKIEQKDKEDFSSIKQSLLFNYFAALDYELGWGEETGEAPTPTDSALDAFAKLAKQEYEEAGRSLGNSPMTIAHHTTAIRFDLNMPEYELFGREQTKTTIGEKITAVLPPFGRYNYYSLTCLCVAAAFRSNGKLDDDGEGWCERALEYLARSVELGANTRERARTDMSLRPLRNHRDYKRTFNDVIA